MKRTSLLILPLLLSACGGSSDITPQNWSCRSLIEPVIEMSRGKDPEILELSNPEEIENLTGVYIKCVASAEWSRGSGRAEYGARVSDGGSLILEYRRR